MDWISYDERCKMNAANALTFFRILILPLLGYLILIDSKLWAFALLLLAAISDGLDGWLARRNNQETKIGKLMDPVADKVLLAVILIFLVADHKRSLSPWIATLLLAREFLITGLRALLAAHGVVMGAQKLAKWKTTFQFIGIGALILFEPFWILNIDFHTIGIGALWISVILSYVSLLSYIKKSANYLDS